MTLRIQGSDRSIGAGYIRRIRCSTCGRPASDEYIGAGVYVEEGEPACERCSHEDRQENERRTER